MANIYDCVDAFAHLLDTEYVIVLGRKGVSVTLRILFDKNDCYHLMGLQYIKDRPELNRDRGIIFDEIKCRILKKENVESSDFYSRIADRIDFLPYLEQILDSNDTIFKYNRRENVYSLIDANYLMKNQIFNRNIYVFLSENKEGNFFCRSFFPETQKDYTKNQALWTLLYKKKINLGTGLENVLYDRLK